MSSFLGMEFSESIFVNIWKYFKQKWQNQKNVNFFLEALIRENNLLNKDWGNDPAYHLDMAAFISMGLKRKDDSEDADLSEVLSRHRRVLIVGGAGSGKSTLTRYVTFQLASAWLKTNRTEIPQLLPGLPTLFPLRIELRHCDGKPLEDLIYESITDVSPEYVKEHLLKQGRVLLLLDGLDEVVPNKRQAEVIEEIDRLTNRYDFGGNQFVVTSRYTSDIYDTLGRAGYEIYHLQVLSSDRKRAMVDSYYQGWAKKGTKVQGDPATLKKRLSTNTGLEELSNNAFLLSQIIFLHHRGESLPTKRHKLYEKCIEGLVVRKDRPTREQKEQRMDALGELALAMRQRKKSFISHHEATQILATICQQNTNLSRISVPANALFDQIVKKWAIMRADQLGYTFVHLSLYQYLVSRTIARNHDKYWELLKHKLTDPSWQEIIFLYIAIRAEIVSGSVTIDEILDTLLNKPDMPEDEIWIKAGFFLSATPYQCQGRWCSKVFERLQMISNSDNTRGIQALETLCLIEPNGVKWVIDEQIIKQFVLRERVLSKIQSMRNPEALLKLRAEIAKQLSDGVPLGEQEILEEVLQHLKKE